MGHSRRRHRQVGSLGSTDEWFSGDGPGPSLRSILTSAAAGRHSGCVHEGGAEGVPLAGTNKISCKGISPRYTLSEIPPNFMARYYSFPSIEKMFQAELKIGESEIAFELMGFNVAMLAPTSPLVTKKRNKPSSE